MQLFANSLLNWYFFYKVLKIEKLIPAWDRDRRAQPLIRHYPGIIPVDLRPKLQRAPQYSNFCCCLLISDYLSFRDALAFHIVGMKALLSIITALTCCVTFTSGVKGGLPMFSSLILSAVIPNSSNECLRCVELGHLHTTEYPGDNYDHILGIDDPNHQLSKLQAISKLRIADTIHNKTPLDPVCFCFVPSCHA